MPNFLNQYLLCDSKRENSFHLFEAKNFAEIIFFKQLLQLNIHTLSRIRVFVCVHAHSSAISNFHIRHIH